MLMNLNVIMKRLVFFIIYMSYFSKKNDRVDAFTLFTKNQQDHLSYYPLDIRRSSTGQMMKSKRTDDTSIQKEVCLIGTGSFGTAIARIVADNLQRQSQNENPLYNPTLKLWARRSSLANDMNEAKENRQYLPGAKLPSNIQVSSNLDQVLEGCQVVIIGIPSNYLSREVLQQIREKTSNNSGDHEVVQLVSLAKGIEFCDGKLTLISDILMEGVHHPSKRFEISVLMGANVADQMGRDEFAEATLGCGTSSLKEATNLLSVFNDPERYAVTLTFDRAAVELSGALKNVVSLAAGYSEGLDLGSNTKAAIIRRGLLEIIKFAKTFYDDVQDETFLESSGVADLMTTCFGGRGRRLAAEFIRRKQEIAWAALEHELFNGQQLPDWHNAQHVYHFLKHHDMLESFPLFTAVYTIGFQKNDPIEIVAALKSQPTEISDVST